MCIYVALLINNESISCEIEKYIIIMIVYQVTIMIKESDIISIQGFATSLPTFTSLSSCDLYCHTPRLGMPCIVTNPILILNDR